jgi:hypothetical protein
MKNVLNIFAIIGLFLASASLANATAHGVLADSSDTRLKLPVMMLAAVNCEAKANSLASSYSGAQILSVTQNGNSCIIVIRVNGKNGDPPRIIRKTVSG